ncbi:MAG: M4 family metallopeptidase [Deltaproteobacteria bacterium]|nr:M4 family metallopeptidase [Deltaproteobacteria bacterium]
MRVIVAFGMALLLFLFTGVVRGDSASIGFRDSAVTARLFLERRGDRFSPIQPFFRLVEQGTHVHLGQSLVHFSLTYQDLPVYFERSVVQIDSKGTVRRVAARVSELPSEQVPHPLSHDPSAKAFAAHFGFSSEEVAGLGWLEVGHARLRPVVRIDTFETNAAEPMSLFVDAETGRVLRAEPLMWTGDPVAAVFPENPLTTPDVKIVPLEYLDGAQRLSGAYAHVGTCIDTEKCKETRPLALRSGDGDGNFIYRPNLDEYSFEDPFAEVNVYRNITSINRWARDTFGWDGLFGEETWIEVRVGRDWYNAAFYAGNKNRSPYLTFGQDIVDFAYDADVAFHEFGHAINRSIWEHGWLVRDNLGVDVAMFGIEEAMADIWAEHYSGDPVMDSYIRRSRTAFNTLTCPETVVAEGHMEARILSGFGWDVREEIGQVAWGHVFYRTLHFLSSRVGFDDFVNELATSAVDLAEEGTAGVLSAHAEIIRRLGEERGLLDEECLSRLVPMREGEPRRVYGYGRNRTGGFDYPFGLQWKIVIPEDTEAVKLFFDWRYPTEEHKEGVVPGFNVHLRRGTPVEVTWFDFEELEEGEQAFEVTADVSFAGAPSAIEYPHMELEPLKAGEELYVLLSSATEESTVVVDSTAYFLPMVARPPDGGVEESIEYHYPTGRDGALSCSAVHPGRSWNISISLLKFTLDKEWL